MAGLSELLPRRELATELDLRIWITEAVVMREITRSQWDAIITAFLPHLPAHLSLERRTPKGVLYVTAFDPRTARRTTYYLNHRAKWIRGAPPPR